MIIWALTGIPIEAESYLNLYLTRIILAVATLRRIAKTLLMRSWGSEGEVRGVGFEPTQAYAIGALTQGPEPDPFDLARAPPHHLM